MRRKSWTTLAAAVAVSLALCAPAVAADGDLDPSFGNGGIATWAGCGFPNTIGRVGHLMMPSGRNVAVQPDGKIVLLRFAVGHESTNFTCVSRLTPNGAPDTSFGVGGDVPVGSHQLVPGELALAPDGKIVVVGSNAHKAEAYRLEPDGDLDPTFDGDGKLAFDFTEEIPSDTPQQVEDFADSVVVQPDGRIVVAGSFVRSFTATTAVARLTAAGALDSTFSGDGRTTQNYSGDNDHGTSVTLQGDRVVVASGVEDAVEDPAVVENLFGVLRLNSDGTSDSSFGDGGRVAVQVGDGGTPSDVLVTPAGLVVTGTANEGGETRGAVLRLDPEGHLDEGFSGDGVDLMDFGPNSRAHASALMPDGGVAVGGSVRDDEPDRDSGTKLALAKLTPSGARRQSFGDGGLRLYPEAEFLGRAVFPRSDGSLLVGGAGNKGTGVARILGASAEPQPEPPAPQSPPVIDLTGGSAIEGQVLIFTATLSRPSDSPVTIGFVTGEGSAATGLDFGGRTGSLTIPAGQTSGTIGIATNADFFYEPADETFRVELFDPVGARFGEYVAFGTIVNDLRPGRCQNVVVGRKGTDVLTGSAAGDLIVGRQDTDFLFGLGGADCIRGERGHDIIDGGDGDDLVDGGSGDDRIRGGDGDDRLYGRRGINRYNGGPGDDRIYARNGRSEIVECGPGRDVVKADRTDRLRRCERVTR